MAKLTTNGDLFDSRIGKRVGDMTRDELFKVIEHLSRRCEDWETPQAVRARALGQVAMIMRGER